MKIDSLKLKTSTIIDLSLVVIIQWIVIMMIY
jgi:hypothetical protein